MKLVLAFILACNVWLFCTSASIACVNSYVFTSKVYAQKEIPTRLLQAPLVSMQCEEDTLIGFTEYKNTGILLLEKYNYNEAIEYLDNALCMASAKKDSALVLNNIGIAYEGLGDYVASFEYYEKAANQYLALGDSLMLAIVQYNTSLSYKKVGIYDKTISLIISALTIFEALGQEQYVGFCYSVLGSVYYDMDDFTQSEYYHKIALSSRKDISDSIGIAGSYNNLGNVYKSQGFYPKAINYYDSSLAIKIVLNDKKMIASTLSNIGDVKFLQSDYNGAKDMYLQSLSFRKQTSDQLGIAIAQDGIANCYLHLFQLQKAKKTLDSASVILKSIDAKTELLQNLSIYKQYYLHSKKLDSALMVYDTYNDLKDSIYNESRYNSILSNTIRYETIKKEKQITLLSKTNDEKDLKITEHKAELMQTKITISYLQLIVITMVLLSGVVFYLFYAKHNDNKKVKAHLAELHHRVKNNLHLIVSLLKIQSIHIKDHKIKEVLKVGEQRVEAMMLVHKKLYAKNKQLNIDMKSYVPELVSNLLSAFNIDEGKVQLKYHIEDIMIDADKAIPICLIINELITNSLKYAFEKIESPILGVRLEKNKDGIISLVVYDNGPGYDPTTNKTDSFGQELIQTLVEQLNGRFEINNQNGLTYKFHFKL